MQTELESIEKEAHRSIADATNIDALEEVRVRYLGKKGLLTEVLKQLSSLSAEERPKFGAEVNRVKHILQTDIKLKQDQFLDQQLYEQLLKDKIDITAPGRAQSVGHNHPITLILQRVEELFHSMGFTVAEGPEIEDEFHNFTALNIPEHHPARAAHDTFYFEDGMLLRTHTSPVQIRTMMSEKPPIRIITPGRVYRHDYDQTHSPMFHQVEGLLVDDRTTFAELKGLLQEFFNQFFEKKITMRFRASYFPFTEPSAEVDIAWGDRWLEVLGCGMVHPNVLSTCNIDPEHYNGFAFGMGLDRLAILQ
jgi:phenylalanyl-tRNA synthetase alpha chain